MALINIGPLAVRVQPFNVHRYEEDGNTAFARKAIVGAANDLEHTGENENIWRLAGKIFPQRIGGLSELEAFEALRVSGVPQLVTRGDGAVRGWYAITSINKTSERLAEDGVGRIIEFTATLERTKAPNAEGYFAAMMGVLA
ncbi:phage tail protein [Microvirga sp. Mcv34]|uniref:phage tail protein n=1 Tax=Microvirga sp. Mcv34 TaxID=2926016 RepID=UPI0021C8F295|nr:phage tail protein [Microvirga sp. Mcv34]